MNDKTQIKYQQLDEITTTCFIPYIDNCFNVDVCFDLNEDVLSRYSSCIKNVCEYKLLNPKTLCEESYHKTFSYRARIKGITVNSSRMKGNYMKSKIANATESIRRIQCKTSGYFICKISDVDTYGRILIVLYDPVTLDCINDMLLESHPEILSEYQVKEPTFTKDGKPIQWDL